MLNKLESKAIGRTLLMAFALLFAGGAMAEVGIPGIEFNPSTNDESLKMLGYLFGGLISQVPGQVSVMASLMQIFNAAILSLASITGFYVIVSAVVQTAHDGEVLGKRYSSLWVPIRAVGGISMMVPASSGFSGVQLLVLWLAAQGVGLANNLYNAGFDVVVRQGGFSPPAISAAAGEDMVAKMVPIAACMVSNSEAIAKAKASGAPDDPKAYWGKQVDTAGGYQLAFGFKYAAEGAQDAVCGTIDVANASANAEYSSPASQLVAESVYNAQAKGAIDAMQVIIDGMSTAASPTSASSDYVAKATAKYRESVSRSVSQSFEQSKGILAGEYTNRIADLKNQGWASFGGSFMVMSKLTNDTIANANVTNIKVINRSIDVYAGSSSYDVKARTEALVERARSSTSQTVGEVEDGDSSYFWQRLKGFFDFTNVKLGGDGVVNPIIKLQSYGNMILVGFVLMMGLMIGLATATGAADGSFWGKAADAATGAVGAAKGGLQTFMMFFIFLFLAAVTLALTMSVYIPMVPYIIWISVLMAWMISVVEAVIATPLWMLMHINPEGDGLANGATEAGYKFMAAVFLRPALSVIAGFSAALILMSVGSFVFNTVDAVRSSSVSGFASVFAWLGQTAIIAAIFMSLVSKTFGLALTIPEAILRWIGSSLTGGQDIEREAGSQFNVMAGYMSSAGGSAARPGQYKPRGSGSSEGNPIGSVTDAGKTGASASKENAAPETAKNGRDA